MDSHDLRRKKPKILNEAESDESPCEDSRNMNIGHEQHDSALRSANSNYPRADPNLNFFYRPHTIIVLILMLLGFLYLAWYQEQIGRNTIRNAKTGLIVSLLVWIIVGVLQLSDGPFIRPHPVVWRAVLAVSIAYLLLLVFIFFQSVDDARSFLKYLDINLGVELPERSYADQCSFTYHNIMEQMDIFVVAHVLGWYGKALILRDYWFCWILSIMFELMEYSLEHTLPNFAECWWDHWILDVLVCNWLGLFLGMKTCSWLDMKLYSWRGVKDYKKYGDKVKRGVQQFTPLSWTKFEWGATRTFKNFVAVIMLLFIVLQCELNLFYLKFILWIPPPHWIVLSRTVIFFFFGLVATREAYQYLTDRKCKRLGAQAWVCIAAIQMETIICIKFGHDLFPNSAPGRVKISWSIGIGCLLLYSVYQFYYKPYRSLNNSSMSAKNNLRIK